MNLFTAHSRTGKSIRLAISAVAGLLIIFLSISLVGAAPVEPFAGSSPSFDAPPSEGKDYNNGDWGVSDQNGSATYTYPIDVPPGRNGMAPSLAVSLPIPLDPPQMTANMPEKGWAMVGFSLP